MNKDDSSSEAQTSTGVLVTDPDPVQIGESSEQMEADTDPETKTESAKVSKSKLKIDNKAGSSPGSVYRFGIFNFVLILALAATAGYYWWQQQQLASEYQRNLAELRQQLSQKASNDGLVAGLTPLQTEVSGLGAKLGQPDRPVIALIGDGAAQFTLGEIASAIEAKAPVARRRRPAAPGGGN